MQMNSHKRILIAIDNSAASVRAARYAAEMIGGGSGFEVCLLHVLEPMPLTLIEVPWTETPEMKKKVEAEWQELRAEWVKKTEQAAQPILEQAQSILCENGIAEQGVETRFANSFGIQAVAADIQEAARAGQYGTIVVGRESYSGFKEFFHHHIGDQLVRKSQGITLWVVE